MKKRIVGVLLVTLVLAFTLAFGAFAESAATLGVNIVPGQQENTVSVTVDVSENTGLSGLQFMLEYDKTKLELVSAQVNSLNTSDGYYFASNANGLSVNEISQLEKISYVFFGGVNTDVNANIMSFTFNVVDDTWDTLPVSLNEIAGSDENAQAVVITPVYTNNTAPSGVTLDKQTLSMIVGENQTLVATVLPEHILDKTVTWASTNADVATVENGVVTAVSKGEAEITATTVNGLSAKCTVNVGVLADKVQFNTQDGVNVNVGETLKLSAQASRQDGETPVNTSVTYSVVSGDQYGSVDSEGNFTAVAIGQVVVRASAQKSLNNAYAEITVNVKSPITALEFTKTMFNTVEGDENQTISLSEYLMVTPEVNTDTLTWTTSAQNVATVDNDGNVTVVGGGHAVITVTAAASGVSASVDVYVGVLADKVSISTQNNQTLNVGQTLKIDAAAVRNDGQEPVNSAVVYEVVSGNAFGEVSSDGTFTANAIGTVVVRVKAKASLNGAFADITINVVDPIRSMEFTKSQEFMTVGMSDVDLKTLLEVVPAVNSDTITWDSSNKDVATVENGVVTAVDKGSAVITATSTSGVSAQITVTVSVLANKVEFETQDNQDLVIGRAVVLKAYALRDDGKEIENTKVTYSIVSGNEFATLEDDGTLTAVKRGNVVVRAQAEESINNAYCDISVNVIEPVPVKNIKFSARSASAVVDGYGVDLAQYLVVNYDEAYTDYISWESANEDIATVDANGVVTAKAKGSVKITATAESGKSAYITVSCGLGADKVEFSALKANSVAVNKTLTLSAKASREDKQKPIDSGVIYEIVEGKEFGEIDERGRFKGIAIGKVVIRATAKATANGAYDEVTVHVVIPVSSVKLSTKKASMVVGGKTLDLGSEVSVMPQDHTDIFTWTSSNEDVATVNENGVVTAVSKGTAKITIKSGSGKSAYCSVTVGLAADVVKFKTLDNQSLAVGKSIPLSAKAEREDGQKPVSSDVTFEIVSGHEYGELDARGRFTAKMVGKVVIRATADASLHGEYSEITLHVVIPVSSIKLSTKKASMVVGGLQLNLMTPDVTILPEGHTDILTWTSSNEDVATVGQNGVVTAVGKGSAKITLKSGSGKSAYCSVTVGLAADKVEITPLKSNTLAVGKTLSIKAKASRIDGQKPVSTAVTYEIVEGGQFGEIDAKGKFKATAIGDGASKVVVRAYPEAALSRDVYDEIEIYVVIPVTSIKLSEKKASMVVGGEELDLGSMLTVLPENNTDMFTWTSSNEDVAIVTDKGVVTAVSKGTAKITVKSGSGKSAYCSVTVGLAADVVEFKTQSQSVAVGKTVSLSAKASRADGEKPISTAVTYEIVEGHEFGGIDSRGRFVAKEIGVVKIKATAEATLTDAHDQITISVVPSLYKIELIEDEVELGLWKFLKPSDILKAYTRDGEEIDVDKYCQVTMKPASTETVGVLEGRLVGLELGKTTVRITVECVATKTATLDVTVVEGKANPGSSGGGGLPGQSNPPATNS